MFLSGGSFNIEEKLSFCPCGRLFVVVVWFYFFFPPFSIFQFFQTHFDFISTFISFIHAPKNNQHLPFLLFYDLFLYIVNNLNEEYNGEIETLN